MPRKMNEYTAVAGAEKRLREMLSQGPLGQMMSDNQIEMVVAELTTKSVEIEYKPRLKALVITIPIPQPAPEPKLGKFEPKQMPEDADPWPGEGDVDDV